MIRVTIRDLHMKTGDWVRMAARSPGIIVMDRRRPVAKMVPFKSGDEGGTFAERRLVAGFARLPKSEHDSTRGIAEDRERA